MKRLLSTIIILSGFILVSCKHVPEEIPLAANPGNTNPTANPCDTNIVFFNQDILPIINSNCAMSGCHDPATAKEGIVLNNYTNIINTGKIIPYSPNSSKLYKEITTTSAKDIMPPAPKPRLTSAQIALIAKWINQGAKDTACTAGNCDSTDFKFSTSISKTITTFCVGCHGVVNPGAGIVLTSYSGVKAIAINGKLIGSIKQLYGYKSMPVGGKLEDCKVKQIQKWIEAGSLNN